MAKGAKAGGAGAGAGDEGEMATAASSSSATSAYASLSFAEVLEDLSSRFIVNLPAEELASIERICFQVEQAHWFYEDFLRPLNPSLPSFSLRRFSSYLLHTSAMTVPLIQRYISASSTKQNQQDLEAAFDEFLKYKTRVPVCGVVMLNRAWDKCLLVKGWKSSSAWGFPKGKINQKESERDCAVREVYEETGFDCGPLLPHDSNDFMELTMREQKIKLYIVPSVDESTHFETLTRKEISKIAWFKLSDLPTWKKNKAPPAGMGGKFYLISPFISKLKQWINENKASHVYRPAIAPPDSDSLFAQSSDPPTAPAALRGATPKGVPKEPAAMRNGHSSSAAKPSQGLLFPDSSTFFPTATAAPSTSRQLQPAEEASTDGLKALLGLGNAGGAGASAQSLPMQGRGAQMIEAQGDARSRQLLDLLRGSSSSASETGYASSPQHTFKSQTPSTSTPSRQLDDRESGTAALLAALNAGAGKASELGAPGQGQSAMLLSLLNGTAEPPPSRQQYGVSQLAQAPAMMAQFPPVLPPNTFHRPLDSPLPAPRAQNTAQHKSLLDLISPAGGSISVSAGQPSKHLEDKPDAQSQAAPIDEKERERARKRDALLANLVGGQMQLNEPLRDAAHNELQPPAQENTDAPSNGLLSMLNGRSGDETRRQHEEEEAQRRRANDFRFPPAQAPQQHPPPPPLPPGHYVGPHHHHHQQQQQQQQQQQPASMLSNDAQTSGLLAMLNFGAAPSSQMQQQGNADAPSQDSNGLLAVLNGSSPHARAAHQPPPHAPHEMSPLPPHLAAMYGGLPGPQHPHRPPPPPHWGGPPPLSMPPPPHHYQQPPFSRPPQGYYHPQQMMDYPGSSSHAYSSPNGTQGPMSLPPHWLSSLPPPQQQQAIANTRQAEPEPFTALLPGK